jgi:CubicO group peptidase (beta-lactamase class C family)
MQCSWTHGITSVAVILALSACNAAPQRSEQLSATDYTRAFDGLMRPGAMVALMERTDELFPFTVVTRAGASEPLPVRSDPLRNVFFTVEGRKFDLFDYLAWNRVAGLLVLKNSQVAYEAYELGATPHTRWASFSVAKSVSATLVGCAVKDGLIQSLDDSLAKYLPELKGSAYDGVSIRNLITMTSGVRWSEAYMNPESDVRKISDIRAKAVPGSIVRFMASLPRESEPGTNFRYSTGETYLLGAVIEAAIKRPLAQYLSEKIWRRDGAEHDATWWLESPGGMGLAGAGLSATLRDYGRFGLFVLRNGDGMLPDNWLAEASKPQVLKGKRVDYGYMWWLVPSGDPIHAGAFRAQGLYGQFIYVNPNEGLVIVVLSARPKPSTFGMVPDNEFFGAVAKALH